MVVGNEGQKQLPMMVFGTEQLAPPGRKLVYQTGKLPLFSAFPIKCKS